MLKRTLFLLILLTMQLLEAFAQGENNVWAFGIHNGLDFSTSPPTFFETSNVSVEGSASVADSAGNLLFYSNGNNVWDASGAVMPNGSGILGNGAYPGSIPGSAAQGVAIIKMPGAGHKYYLFTLDALEQLSPTYTGYLRYSVVDMSLNGGAGDVVAAQKNIVMDSSMSEKMTIAASADCGYWLVAHRNDAPVYRAFKIDAAGIHPGVSSTGSWYGGMSGGQMKISHDGSMIANSVEQGVELGAFDNITGMVSGTGFIDSMPGIGHFGTAFSPDNQRLYITTYSDIAQYNLSAFPNLNMINSSKTVLAPAPSAMYGFGQMRNGPDGKIYVGFFLNYAYLSVINNPNNAGTSCNFVLNALTMPPWSIQQGFFSVGLGNDVIMLSGNGDTTAHSITDTVLCTADTFRAEAAAGCSSYHWNDGDTSRTRSLTTDGTYWVHGYQNCGVLTDTVKVQFMHLHLDLGNDTTICPGDRLLLHATQEGATYRWQDNSTGATFDAAKGTYSVTIAKGECSLKDTIHIEELNPYITIAEDDTTICEDNRLTLHTIAPAGGAYAWSDGSSLPQLVISRAGVYTITLTNACGTYQDSVTIGTIDCSCEPFIPNVFSPNGDGKNDRFGIRLGCDAIQFSMRIFNRYGQCVFQATSPNDTWDGTFGGQVSDAGAYFYFIRYLAPLHQTIERKGDMLLIR